MWGGIALWFWFELLWWLVILSITSGFLFPISGQISSLLKGCGMNKVQTHSRISLTTSHPFISYYLIPKIFHTNPIKCFIILQVGPMLSFPLANIYSSNTIPAKRSALFSQSEVYVPSASSACSYGVYHTHSFYAKLFSSLISGLNGEFIKAADWVLFNPLSPTVPGTL